MEVLVGDRSNLAPTVPPSATPEPAAPVIFVDSGQRLGMGRSREVALGDLDGDGDLDAFVAHGELGLPSGGEVPNEVWLNESPG